MPFTCNEFFSTHLKGYDFTLLQWVSCLPVTVPVEEARGAKGIPKSALACLAEMPINPLLCCSNNDLQQGWLPARVTNSSWFVGVIPHFSTESPQSQASWDSCSTYLQLAKGTLEFGAVGIKLGSTFLSSTCPRFGKLKALSGEVLRQPIIRTLVCWQRRSNLWCTLSFCRNGKLDFFLFLLCIFNVTEQGINGYGWPTILPGCICLLPSWMLIVYLDSWIQGRKLFL